MGARILIADDDQMVRTAVEKILTIFNHDVLAVGSGGEVLENIDERYDVILLDINMPDMDGFETLSCLNERQIDIPVIFLTGAGSMDYAVKAINLGAYDFITKPISDIDLFNVKIKRAVEKRTYVRRETDYKFNLEQEVQRQTQELAEKNDLLEAYGQQLEKATLQIMSSLQAALEEKDKYTAGHTERVIEYSVMIGKKLALSEEELLVLKRAANFHDIGKLVIELSCIQKPGKLTDTEWELIKKHPEVGANIIKPLTFLERERKIIIQHHEHLDGGGYPFGISGDEIELLTRIITVADSYDAMTSRRNYRRNFSTDEAIAELRNCCDTWFDRDVVEAFVELTEGLPAITN